MFQATPARQEVIASQPLFARAEPDDEYDFPKPEPHDPWSIEQEERAQKDEEMEDEDEE
jgi:hypothetical protein